METLEGKVAVVTGAASGIGRSTAIELAQRGCHVALVDIDEKGLSETNARISADKPATSVRAVAFEVDVSDAASVDELADDVVGEFGAVHIVINNAGINVTAPFEAHSLDDFRRVFDVNLWGVIHGCKTFLPHLRNVDQGHIVNVSSGFGIVAVAGQSAYCASKFAVRGLTESLYEELSNTSIGVTGIYPGCIDTNIIAEADIHYDADVVAEIGDYFTRHGCQPEKVGRCIVDAILEDKHRVLVTAEARFFDWVRRLAPTVGNRLANRAMTHIIGVDFEE